MPDGVEVGARVQEAFHVEDARSGEGGVCFATDSGEKGQIVQEVSENPEGDFVGVVVDSEDCQPEG